MEEEDGITFPEWNAVYEYRHPVDTTSLSAKFAAIFVQVSSLLYSRVERTVILNYITQDSNNVL